MRRKQAKRAGAGRCAVAAFLCVILAATTCCGATTTGYTIEPVPSWVDAIGLPEGPGKVFSNNTAGVVYQLVDKQVRLEPTIESYGHIAYKITAQTAIQAFSQLTVTFDPSYQSLALHSILVHRNGTTTSRLSTQKVNIIQREKNLELQIYDGCLSALMFVDDIRVGDVVEYAYTVRGANPIFDGKFSDMFYLGWGAPIRHLRQRVIVPANRRLVVKQVNTTAEPEVRTTEAGEEYSWDVVDADAIISDSLLPAWYTPFHFVQVSEFADWSEVVNWALTLYKPPEDTPAEAVAVINEWKSTYTNQEDRIKAAIRFVQDEVRYLGIEMGPNSHRPTAPEEVLQRRFGDCKEKSLLLCTLLHGLGVEAHPALVNTFLGRTVSDRVSSPFTFDHVIVQYRLNGKDYWVDPTRSHQRGPLEELYLPYFGKALVIREGNDKLTDIPQETPSLPFTTITESYDIHGETRPVKYHVELVYRSNAADDLRAGLAVIDPASVERNYLNYFAQIYPSIRVETPMQISDDATTDVITVSAAYEIPSFWTAYADNTVIRQSFYPRSINEFIRQPEEGNRRMPLGVAHPQYVVENIVINLNEPWNVGDAFTVLSNSAIAFVSSITYNNPTIRLSYSYRTLSDFVSLDQIKEHTSLLKTLGNQLTFEISKPRAPGTAVERFAGRVNWMIIFVSALWVILMLVAVFLVYLWAAKTGQAAPDVPYPSLIGIRGWLLLFAIKLCITPPALLLQISMTLPCYGPDTWTSLTSRGMPLYHVLWAPILIGELLGNLFLLIFSILLCVLFFQKRRKFPVLIVGFLFCNLALIVLDYIAGMQLPYVLDQTRATSPVTGLKTVVGAIIWIWYFSVSKRVKSTFTQ